MKLFRCPFHLPEYRTQKLTQTLRFIHDHIKKIASDTLYFVDTQKTAPSTLDDALSKLLHAQPIRCIDSPPPLRHKKEKTAIIIVIPRLGTLSSWSSKATDIARNVGLTEVKRIEKGTMYRLYTPASLHAATLHALTKPLYDPMTESVVTLETIEELYTVKEFLHLFDRPQPKPITYVPFMEHGINALYSMNLELGLALSHQEIKYLATHFSQLKRNPTDAEIIMFAQANSEHCRHKIFNTTWKMDQVTQKYSLFQMIKSTYHHHNKGILSAYKDNAAVISGFSTARFFPHPKNRCYQTVLIPSAIIMKVETHNHPTAISPYAGASTGAGGEIRDEGATGLGAKPKAGLTGFSVSHLHIPHFVQPWEKSACKPAHIASSLEIMLEAPIGSAGFNNEFGRPNLCGYFRTYEHFLHQDATKKISYGYHKPIMIAGGMGDICTTHVKKKIVAPGAKLIVLGGPAMKIGLGGSAASSKTGQAATADLDFASVQRDNPEMQRRCQEVIDRCWQQGEKNPILFIHDVGAGGLSNALPELVHDGGVGGTLYLRDIPSDEPAMSPAEIWCNEAQERYVLALEKKSLKEFASICQRERCPYAVVGEATQEKYIRVWDTHFGHHTVNLSLAFVLENTPQTVRCVQRTSRSIAPICFAEMTLNDATHRVLTLPAVANKSFLITISDRSVTGQVAREQMIGPWQVPVGNYAVTCNGYTDYHGSAMAMGERAPIAPLNAPASGRMAVGEAITNIAATDIGLLSNIKLSANWMAAAGNNDEDIALFDTVKAVTLELCTALNLTIPVGKDSLSMQTSWKEKEIDHTVIAPLSLVISAFAPVRDIRKSITPQLRTDVGHTTLVLIDLGRGANRMGASALSQVYRKDGGVPPDLDHPHDLAHFFSFIQHLLQNNLLLSYHDRSDGGLWTTLLEMAFAGRTGLRIDLHSYIASPDHAINALFSEELGAVIQVKTQHIPCLLHDSEAHDLSNCIHIIGTLAEDPIIECYWHDTLLLSGNRIHYQRRWSETSFHLQTLRDAPQCAQQEFDNLLHKDPGLHIHWPTSMPHPLTPTVHIFKKIRPRVAILREQGVNGHVEMAAAFDRAGFETVDVHMSDLIEKKDCLSHYHGLVACGGFSYGDVLGAGAGWAQSILHHAEIYDMFAAFFHRSNTFSLGVCNGCQMLSRLQSLIPGAERWPTFVRNASEQFEARTVMVKVEHSPSIFFHTMQSAHLAVVIAHGEGRVSSNTLDALNAQQQIALRYIDNTGKVTERYPYNPNGSPQGITGLTSCDGRATILMPHPERAFRCVQNNWRHTIPTDEEDHAPWMHMFYSARQWLN